MPETYPYVEGTKPLQADSEHKVNQKILLAIRAERAAVVEGGDADLVSLANISGTGILARVGDGDWRTRTLIAPSSGFFIDNPNGVSDNPTFRLDNTIGSPPYIRGILSALEAAGGTGFAPLDLTNLPPFGPSSLQRTISALAGITVTNGNGLAGNPTIALNINGLTEEGTADDLDYIAIYDISGSDHNKITRRDVLVGLAAASPSAKAARISSSALLAPPIAANIHTAHPFDTEDFDTDTIATLGSSNTRLTCKTAGRYVICAGVQWDSQTLGNRREIWIRKNGTTRLATTTLFATHNLGPEQNLMTAAQLAVNDYIELMVFTNGAGGLAAGNHLAMLAYA